MNALIMAVRRRRIAFSQVLEFAEALAALPIYVGSPTPPAAWDPLLPLLTTALETKLTIYDAAYLQLARKIEAPLATLDTDLQNAARAVFIPLVPLA